MGNDGRTPLKEGQRTLFRWKKVQNTFQNAHVMADQWIQIMKFEYVGINSKTI